MASVTLERVSKLYGRVPAVDDVSVTIDPGEFLVLLGPSGCGKTTTLRMIAGLIEASRGVIRIGGADVTGWPARKRNIGMVFQDYALFPHLDVAKNIAFGLRERGADKATIGHRLAELLSLVRLAGFEGRYPDQLSGGQQQRVALARAIACSPSVLLMDEPLGALDLKLREAMQIELRRVQRELGITTIFVTHDQSEAMALADRIAVMAEGRIQQIGTPEDLYRRPASTFVASFVGKMNFLAGSIRTVSGEHCAVALDGGSCVEAAAPAGCRAGDRVMLGLRPENLVASPADEAVTGPLAGTVEQRRYFGNIVHYLVRAGSGPPLLVEQTAAASTLAIGERVVVGWRAEQALVFTEATPG